MSLIDDCTRYVFAYLQTTRFGGVGALRTDNGGEYTSNAFKQHLVDNGIFAQRTAPDTPQQNGVAERMNRTIFEMGNAC
jgi:transposase InsO family protein